MAVILLDAIKRYAGLSTDTKPILAAADVGSLFTETDTFRVFVWNGSAWGHIAGEGINGYNGTNWWPVRIDAATYAMDTIEYEHHEIHSGSAFFLEGYTTLGNGGTLYVKLVTSNTTRWTHLVWEIWASGILTATLDEDATGGMAGGTRPTIHASNRNTNCWTGTHTGANNQATILTDATKTWTVDELVGMQVFNTTDGSSGIITANTADTVTVAALAGGAGNDWDTNDTYEINQTGMVATSGVTACTGYIQRIEDVSFGSRAAGGEHSHVEETILKQNAVYCRSFISGVAANVVGFKATWYEHTDRVV